MGGPVSLRNIPPQALHLAHRLCEQTGLSIADVLRQAIVSGLLVEATKLAPAPDGTLGGLEAAYLARALRRHLSSAIDVLLEYEQHPYQIQMAQGSGKHVGASPEKQAPAWTMPEQSVSFEGAIGEDLDTLGLGLSLSAAQAENKFPYYDERSR